jgi:hypothetical protein
LGRRLARRSIRAKVAHDQSFHFAAHPRFVRELGVRDRADDHHRSETLKQHVRRDGRVEVTPDSRLEPLQHLARPLDESLWAAMGRLCRVSSIVRRPALVHKGCMTPATVDIDALGFQLWGRGVSIPGADQASDCYRARIGFAVRQLSAKNLEYRQGE